MSSMGNIPGGETPNLSNIPQSDAAKTSTQKKRRISRLNVDAEPTTIKKVSGIRAETRKSGELSNIIMVN